MDERALARGHVGWFAHYASRGRWHLYDHLAPVVDALGRVMRGECKRLLVMMPPRHGKSELVSKYFPAFYAGNNPHHQVVLAAYGHAFARTWGRKARDLLADCGPELWGVGISEKGSQQADWLTDAPDTAPGSEGGMVTAGVGGPINGRGAHLFIVDDPIKNAEEAGSPTKREAVWEWWTSTARTRLEPGAAVVMVMTRWNEDDLFGRILEEAKKAGREDEWEVIKLPALAEEDDPLGRLPGEALCPERYDAEDLEAIRDDVGAYVWSALFQQTPIVKGGDLFKRADWRFVWADELPEDVTWIRAWDKAATDEEQASASTCSTAGVKVGRRDGGGPFFIADARSFQLDTAGVQTAVKQTAEEDGLVVEVVMEQEPGSSGKDVIYTYRTEHLDRYVFRGVIPSGDKPTRWRLVAGHQQFHNVYLVRRRHSNGEEDVVANAWIEPYIKAMGKVPRGGKDEADATALGFSELLGHNSSTVDVSEVPKVQVAMGRDVASVRSKIAAVTSRAFPMSGRRKGW